MRSAEARITRCRVTVPVVIGGPLQNLSSRAYLLCGLTPSVTGSGHNVAFQLEQKPNVAAMRSCVSCGGRREVFSTRTDALSLRLSRTRGAYAGNLSNSGSS